MYRSIFIYDVPCPHPLRPIQPHFGGLYLKSSYWGKKKKKKKNYITKLEAGVKNELLADSGGTVVNKKRRVCACVC